MFLFLTDEVQINKVLLAACFEHQLRPWQPRGTMGGSCCLQSGWTLLSPDPASTVPTASRQQDHSRPLLHGMSGLSPVLALGAAGLCQDWGHSTQAVPPSPQQRSGVGLRTKARSWAGQGLGRAIFASRLKAFVWLCSCNRSRSGLLSLRKGFLSTNSLLHNKSIFP